MSDFPRYFLAIHGFKPFLWQEELFERFVSGEIPRLIDLPTGAGKTSVMTVWLIALAEQVSRGAVTLSRRLVWVVDRRVVVDQATLEAENLVKSLDQNAELAGLADALRQLSGGLTSSYPLAVSTLRGEKEDNRDWSKNPARPAIIVGTVDMIGSRLLFSGYGDGRGRRPQHAGLLGTDTLIVNDEAHLTPAFAQLIGSIARRTSMRPILLSATQRANDEQAFPVSLDQDLAVADSVFAKRFRAVKRLHLGEPSEKPQESITELALKPDRRTIVFVRSPEFARKLGAAIEKAHNIPHVPLITGMQRGKERDNLLENETVKRYFSKDAPLPDAPPCWIVATSAGEVGIDLSADRLITDLDTADHLLQRFGRLNRFGVSEGDAYVFYSEKELLRKDDGERLQSTLAYLRACGGSVSPEVLRKQPPPSTTLSATPSLAPLMPWLIDVWSLTSILNRDWRARPEVAPWLHGEQDPSAPETYVVWRNDVEDLADADYGVTEDDLKAIFKAFPIRAYERVKQYTNKLCEDLRESQYSSTRAILIGADATVQVGTLRELLGDEAAARFATLVLPPNVGYLDANGMVDWAKGPNEKAEYDVSTSQGDRQKSKDNTLPEGLRERRTMKLTKGDDDEATVTWTYYVKPKDKPENQSSRLLSEHQQQVADVAADLAVRLNLNERVFRWAGQWHDQGKIRPIWQRAVRNPADSLPVAKSDPETNYFNGRSLGGYRHEFGSLIDAENQLPADFSVEDRDLALHLIASHHGSARPHFEERAYDKQGVRRSRDLAIECTQRFGRLQQRCGPWGLAYIEAVFRAADAIVSEGLPELPPDA